MYWDVKLNSRRKKLQFYFPLQEKSLKASGNVASFAGELSPADLASIARQTLSASSKFTGKLSGGKVSQIL